jgi:beta-galactosidase/beta-glucuronidase
MALLSGWCQGQPGIGLHCTDEQWQLWVDDQPFFIKGVVGHTYLEKVKTYGGNSVRIGYKKENLDLAHQLGLYALVNLPAGAERSGMDYDDAASVQAQIAGTVKIVEHTRNHPAVLMWSIGNELDYIPGTLPYKLSLWDAVNETAKAI